MAKVLVVEDSPDMCEQFGIYLEFEKHSYKIVQTGMEGWKQISTNEFDIAFLDWDLPDLNGLDILKQHRAANGTTAVIMVTGRTQIDEKEEALDAGANDYLTKPFHFKELGARMRAALRSQQAAAPLPKALGKGNEQLLKDANLAGTVLSSRYEFLEQIGIGGFARVYKAKPPYLEKFVAVKMLQSSELRDETIARFEREAKALSLLDHPNIITVQEFGVTEKRNPYMVMEFIKGKSLDLILKEEGCLPLGRGLDILIEVCDGIAHAHDMGILHRDLKPENIMLKEVAGRAPVPKILDFGLVKLMEADAQKSAPITQQREVFGSPHYMSPEQVRGKVLDERSDIYSIACMMFEVLTGVRPHDGENAVDVMFKHLDESPRSLQEANPAVEYPAKLQEIVSKAMELHPDDRYQTTRELKKDLELVRAEISLV